MYVWSGRKKKNRKNQREDMAMKNMKSVSLPLCVCVWRTIYFIWTSENNRNNNRERPVNYMILLAQRAIRGNPDIDTHYTHTHTTICVAEWKKYTVTRHDTKQCMQLYSHVPLCLCAFLPLPFPLSFFLRGMKEDDKFMPENKFRTFFVVARLISLAYHFQLIQSDMLWYWLIYVLWIL